jgi:hypothetical protein
MKESLKLTDLDYEIFGAVQKRPGATAKEIYTPLIRPGWGKTKLIERIKLLVFANFLVLKDPQAREREIHLTYRARDMLAKREAVADGS